MVSTHFVFVSEGCVRRWQKEPVGELVSPGAVPHFESFPPDAGQGSSKASRARTALQAIAAKGLVHHGTAEGLVAKPAAAASHHDLCRLDSSRRGDVAENADRSDLPPASRRRLWRQASPAEPHRQRAERVFRATDRRRGHRDHRLAVLPRAVPGALHRASRSSSSIPGHDYFCDAVLPLVRERCTIIDLHYDGRGLPQVNAEHWRLQSLRRRGPAARSWPIPANCSRPDRADTEDPLLISDRPTRRTSGAMSSQAAKLRSPALLSSKAQRKLRRRGAGSPREIIAYFLKNYPGTSAASLAALHCSGTHRELRPGGASPGSWGADGQQSQLTASFGSVV